MVLHSDPGSQFTSSRVSTLPGCSQHHVQYESAVGNCYDNGAVESFYGLLIRERVNRRRYTTRAEARAEIFENIERFYNQRKRRKLVDMT